MSIRIYLLGSGPTNMSAGQMGACSRLDACWIVLFQFIFMVIVGECAQCGSGRGSLCQFERIHHSLDGRLDIPDVLLPGGHVNVSDGLAV